MNLDFPQLSPLKRETLNKTTETYYQQLKESPTGIDYLKTRGITGDVALRFKLGFVLDPMAGHDKMQGMLSIPYLTPLGTVAVRFRRLSGEGGKYHQEAGSRSPLYNVRDLHRPETYLVICEGELDAVVMSGLCGVPAVALAGTGQWQKQGKFYRRLLADYDRVFVVVDPDQKGQEIVPDIMKRVPNAVNIILPAQVEVAGETVKGDVNNVYLAYGREFLLKELDLWDELSETQPSVSIAA